MKLEVNLVYLKRMKKKEKLLKELSDVNNEVFLKVHKGICEHDFTGNDFEHFVKALRYVPNHIIKKWIKKCKSEIKLHKQKEMIGEGNKNDPTRI